MIRHVPSRSEVVLRIIPGAMCNARGTCAAKRLGVARGASIIPAHGNAQAALLARRVVFKTKGQSEAGATSHCRCPYPDAYWGNASSRYMQGSCPPLDRQRRHQRNSVGRKSRQRVSRCDASWRQSKRIEVLQEDVLVQRDAVVGNQRNFAQTVNDYIEKKLRGE